MAIPWPVRPAPLTPRERELLQASAGQRLRRAGGFRGGKLVLRRSHRKDTFRAHLREAGRRGIEPRSRREGHAAGLIELAAKKAPSLGSEVGWHRWKTAGRMARLTVQPEYGLRRMVEGRGFAPSSSPWSRRVIPADPECAAQMRGAGRLPVRRGFLAGSDHLQANGAAWVRTGDERPASPTWCAGPDCRHRPLRTAAGRSRGRLNGGPGPSAAGRGAEPALHGRLRLWAGEVKNRGANRVPGRTLVR